MHHQNVLFFDLLSWGGPAFDLFNEVKRVRFDGAFCNVYVLMVHQALANFWRAPNLGWAIPGSETFCASKLWADFPFSGCSCAVKEAIIRLDPSNPICVPTPSTQHLALAWESESLGKAESRQNVSKHSGQESCRTKVSRIFRIFIPNFAPNSELFAIGPVQFI